MPTTTDSGYQAWLRHARATSLLLGSGAAGSRDPAAVVTWFGAMQAQDLASASWSLGVRTGAPRAVVSQALEAGTIVRTWPMRGTLHMVPGADARWMVRHLAQRSLRPAASRRTELGIDDATAERACDVLAALLAEGPRTRSECLAALAEAGIGTEGQRGYHLLFHASSLGLTCVGPNRGREQTFALMDSWVPPGSSPERAEALAIVAGRFVRSHGPVTVHDLARWADVTVTDARAAVAALRGIVEWDAADRRLLMTEELVDRVGPPPTAGARRIVGRPPARALPGFDELVLGYRDRSAQLDRDHEPLVVPGGNGVFQPTLVLDGRVVGTWRRRELARRVDLTARPFGRLPARGRRELERALAAYGDHVDLPARIAWADP